jgi:3-hydroxyisobutyrate dehydrogenase
MPHLRYAMVVVVHSSVLPQTVRNLEDLLAPFGVVVDAPVSGSRPAADAGTLTVLVGGQDEAVDRVRPVLASYRSHVIHAGVVGAGQLLKIANKRDAPHEPPRSGRGHALRAGPRHRRDLLIATANLSSGRSWVTETWGLMDDTLVDHPLAGTEAIYPIMSEEMRHAVELSRTSLIPLPLTALGTQLSKSYFVEREELGRQD